MVKKTMATFVLYPLTIKKLVKINLLLLLSIV